MIRSPSHMPQFPRFRPRGIKRIKESSSMIGVLIFPDFQLLDAAGPISVFEIAARYARAAPSIRVVAAAPGPVRSSSGAELLARKFGPVSAFKTLLIAGGD